MGKVKSIYIYQPETDPTMTTLGPLTEIRVDIDQGKDMPEYHLAKIVNPPYEPSDFADALIGIARLLNEYESIMKDDSKSA